MNSVGIDISKGRSTVAAMRPFGEVVISPFEVRHTDSELSELAEMLKSLDGETRMVMEAIGNYHTPVALLNMINLRKYAMYKSDIIEILSKQIWLNTERLTFGKVCCH